MIRHSRTCECPAILNPRGSVCFVLSMVEVVHSDILTFSRKRPRRVPSKKASSLKTVF